MAVIDKRVGDKTIPLPGDTYITNNGRVFEIDDIGRSHFIGFAESMVSAKPVKEVKKAEPVCKAGGLLDQISSIYHYPKPLFIPLVEEGFWPDKKPPLKTFPKDPDLHIHVKRRNIKFNFNN